MAIWMQRSDGYCQIVPVVFNCNLAHVRDAGWDFPRILTTRAWDGTTEIEMIGERKDEGRS